MTSAPVQEKESESGISLARERRRKHRQDTGRRRRRRGEKGGEEATDGVGVNGEGQGSEVVGVVSSSSSLEEEVEGGKREREEEEFFTLLDSTLQCEGSPESREVCGGVGTAALRPGRLRERISALRRFVLCLVN